jgi:hypothetical protein
MKAVDPNPEPRWRAISNWYAEVAAQPGWNFLAPMVSLTAWVAEQPCAA